MKYIWYLPHKIVLLLFYAQRKIQKAQPNVFLGRFSFDFTFPVCLLSQRLFKKAIGILQLPSSARLPVRHAIISYMALNLVSCFPIPRGSVIA